jgi:hypothetical protein
MRLILWLAPVLLLSCGPARMRGEACTTGDPFGGACDTGLVCSLKVCRTKCSTNAHCPSGCVCSRGALGIDSVGHCQGGDQC